MKTYTISRANEPVPLDGRVAGTENPIRGAVQPADQPDPDVLLSNARQGSSELCSDGVSTAKSERSERLKRAVSTVV